jgi:predicted regulator of Ras-like GTPase activity (Roadblock/LC7/MglB family)
MDAPVTVTGVNAAEALADLMEISSQIEAAVLADSVGAVAASTLPDEERSREVARLAQQLLATADDVRTGLGDEQALSQIEVALATGSIFVVREGGRVIAATTRAEPTTGLVFYDLRSCLRNVAEAQAGAAEEEQAPAKPGRRRRTRRTASNDAVTSQEPGEEGPDAA